MAVPLNELALTTSLPMRYFEHSLSPTGPLLLLLHGYLDSGPAFFRRVFANQKPNYSVLAPNALFPIPTPSENGYRETYGWYFVDYERQKTFIAAQVARDYLRDFLEKLGYTNRPIVIAGFSQGGYLAPLIAALLPNCVGVVGIGCGYTADSYPQGLQFPLHAVHGDADEVILPSRSLTQFDELQKNTQENSFTWIPGMTHSLNADGAEIVRNRVGALFSTRAHAS